MDMDQNKEYIHMECLDGSLFEGNALLYNKNRLSELFNDVSLRFILMDDVTDAQGRRKEGVFINKDMILWAAPKDIRHSTETTFYAATEYVEVSVKTMRDVVITGRINLQVFSNVFDMLRYTGPAPFLVLINARDTNGTVHHTLFVNKAAIVHIDSRP